MDVHGKHHYLRCLIKFRWMSNCVFVLLQEIMGSFPHMLVDVDLVADACALSGSGKTVEVMSLLYANTPVEEKNVRKRLQIQSQRNYASVGIGQTISVQLH